MGTLSPKHSRGWKRLLKKIRRVWILNRLTKSCFEFLGNEFNFNQILILVI